MSTTELIELINSLPSDKQKEVQDFVSSLLVDKPNESIAQFTGYGSSF